MQEIEKSLKVGFIKEINFTTLLANAVMILKSSRKWRMCVDFTDLNKACPKDAYLVPSINNLVYRTSEAKFLNFMDAYSGYNQVRMHPLDEEKMAFIIENANYCYKIMPFGLKMLEPYIKD